MSHLRGVEGRRYKHRPRIARAAARAAGLLASLALSASALASSASAATWSVAHPPFTTPWGVNVPFAPLYGIGAISSGDVWAVGEVSGTPLTENWNGRKWSSVALPNGPCSVFENSCVLTGVSGDSASDVIAVGHAILASNSGWVATGIAFHWNGSAWAPVPVPSGASSYSEFEHVKVFSPTDAWAVGNGSSGSANGVSTLHWNGSGWTQVPTGFATANTVTVGAISGSSPTDVWVVGQTVTPGYHHRQFTSFALHYDGTGWTQVAVPNNSGLFDVYALSRTNAWAVAGDGSVLRWDGSAWTVLTQVYGGKVVAALSPTDVWVAGVVSIGHYGGSGWTTTPVPSGFDAPSGGGVGVAPGHIWFAGTAYQSNGDEVPAVLSTSNG